MVDCSASGVGHFPVAGAAFERGWVAATICQIYVPAGSQGLEVSEYERIPGAQT